MQEYFVAATRKLGISAQDAKRRVVLYSRCGTVTLAPADLLTSVHIHRRHRTSIREGLIVRAALDGNRTTLHTEDLSPGRVIESLAISYPFAPPSGS